MTETDKEVYKCKKCGFVHYVKVWDMCEWTSEGCPHCDSYSFLDNDFHFSELTKDELLQMCEHLYKAFIRSDDENKENYYFKTTGQEPDLSCIEYCKIVDDGTMIGSANCKSCGNCQGFDDSAQYIKCDKLKIVI